MSCFITKAGQTSAFLWYVFLKNKVRRVKKNVCQGFSPPPFPLIQVLFWKKKSISWKHKQIWKKKEWVKNKELK